jgi:F0F1-type ATP synthase gamma subunit
MNVNKNLIRNKLKLVKTTKKICEAMKLISVVRLKKTNNRMSKLKPYYEGVYHTFEYLFSHLKISHYYQSKIDPKKYL